MNKDKPFKSMDAAMEPADILDRIFSHNLMLMAYLDRSFNYIRVNDTFAAVAGHGDTDHYVGKNHFELFPSLDAQRIFEKVVKSGKPHSVTEYNLFQGADVKTTITDMDWLLQPVENEDGILEGLILTIIDVSERTKTRARLEKERRDKERMRNLSLIGTLSTTIAHELRNPLGVIRTAAFNIRRKRANRAIDKHLDNIEKMIVESNQTINNLLNYSRIKKPKLEKIDIGSLLDDTVVSALKRFRKRAVIVERNLETIDGVSIDGDRYQLIEVLNNVLNNAFQAVPEEGGRILVDGTVEPEAITISIADNGPGLENDVLDSAFDPFFTTKSKGTGLGLAISREIIEMHNGEICIVNTPEGATVTIRLPIKHECD